MHSEYSTYMQCHYHCVMAMTSAGATSLDWNAGAASGLCLLTKLKYEHVYLTSRSKMRVDLAAQVQAT